MEKKIKEPRAGLCGQIRISQSDLTKTPTPEETRTWKPVPHSSIIETIKKEVKKRGWQFMGKGQKMFDLCVSKNYNKLFGTTRLLIPELEDGNNEFGMALGFRHSHDKSMGVSFAVGTNVFVCSNMQISADVVLGKKHSRKLSLKELVAKAFDEIPFIAKDHFGWFGDMRGEHLSHEESVVFLVEAVKRGALPLTRLMTANERNILAREGDIEASQIEHGGTLWAVYQSVTAEYRGASNSKMMDCSKILDQLAKEYLSK